MCLQKPSLLPDFPTGRILESALRTALSSCLGAGFASESHYFTICIQTIVLSHPLLYRLPLGHPSLDHLALDHPLDLSVHVVFGLARPVALVPDFPHIGATSFM